jgi:TrmH family RNA methyltransferase
MLTNKQIKNLKSLQLKKYRDETDLFVAEGDKLIKDLLDSDFEIKELYTTKNSEIEKGDLLSEKEMSRISGLHSSSSSLAVFSKKKNEISSLESVVLALEDIRDPGNLGTIIRLCDWFGVKQIVCSSNSVDFYNPKVVQSSMGSLRNVELHYVELVEFIKEHSGSHTLLGTYVEGKDIKEFSFPEKVILLMGNEGKGISDELAELVNQKISISPANTSRAESLNLANATGIILHQISL